MAGPRNQAVLSFPPYECALRVRLFLSARTARNKTCRVNSDNPTPALCAAWATSRFSADGILTCRSVSLTGFAITPTSNVPAVLGGL